MTSPEVELNSEQKVALAAIQTQQSFFLSGAAGSGKSFVIKRFLSGKNFKKVPVLASTGAAAVLIGGRTFHSFFGIGLLEGGASATFERCKRDRRISKRIKLAETLVIDEVSMLPGQALEVAEALCRLYRDPSSPWGGLQVIFVGDFAQLPPVSQSTHRDWAFLSPAWKKLQMQTLFLSANERASTDSTYQSLLNQVRNGFLNAQGEDLLNSRLVGERNVEKLTQLFSRRAHVEAFNQQRLEELPGTETTYHTIFLGDSKYLATAKKQSPVPETIVLKKNCKVMILQNDPKGRWVNGSLGHIKEHNEESLKIELLNGRMCEIPKSTFTILDGDGEPICSILQFPVMLAYATTIHKSQGSTMDELCVDLNALWEPGQAYVALSRLRRLNGLHLRRWNRRSVIVDPQVVHFYSQSTALIPNQIL